MKTFARLIVAVTIAVTAAASASHLHGHHGHGHGHGHHTRKVRKRGPDVTNIITGPTVTVYQLDGHIVDSTSAKNGLANGSFVIVSSSYETSNPLPPPLSTKEGASQVINTKSTSTNTTPPSPLTTTSSHPPPPPSSTAQVPVVNAATSSNDDSSGVGGEDTEFPSGKIKCSQFPSQYGAVALEWLEVGGWVGLQEVPDYTPGLLSISNIVTGIAGQTCTPGTFCSYACKPGYQKSQWPAAQGAAGQSVGGLWCNQDGYLELTRPSVKLLCIPGQGGVFIKNDLTELVSTCRTEYPGCEGMYIPTVAQPGQTVPLTNPSQSGYYQWKGMKTSAQYYINPKGVAAKDACLWTSPISPSDRGNWAAVNAGVGQDDNGVTFISLFLNKPTSSATPDFNLEIIGGNSICSFADGVWYGGDGGCTTALAKGQSATIRYY